MGMSGTPAVGIERKPPQRAPVQWHAGIVCWYRVLVSCAGIVCWYRVLVPCAGIVCWYRTRSECDSTLMAYTTL